VLQAIEWIAKLDVRQRIPTSAHFSQKPWFSLGKHKKVFCSA
jgi:hypothetical protein